jgi:hypothetical protein
MKPGTAAQTAVFFVSLAALVYGAGLAYVPAGFLLGGCLGLAFLWFYVRGGIQE